MGFTCRDRGPRVDDPIWNYLRHPKELPTLLKYTRRPTDTSSRLITLQKRVLYPPSEMLDKELGRVCPERDLERHMWIPLGWLNHGNMRSYWQCHAYSPINHSPTKELQHVTTPLLFSTWGMDILELFPIAKGQVKFLLVNVYYFTKWNEVEPLAKITNQKVQNILWQNILCRYGVPNSVVIDDATQFVSKTLCEFYENLQITHKDYGRALAQHPLGIPLLPPIRHGRDPLPVDVRDRHHDFDRNRRTLSKEELFQQLQKSFLLEEKPQPSGGS
ncbi:hypothetical protein CR513_17512, partial [Mucuna pruriens]